jgi:hypothetical protein
MPYIAGIAGVIILYIIYGLFSKTWNPIELAKGDDGLPSSSVFQFVLWTIVAVFAYITIYVDRVQHGESGPMNEIPTNLLILIGISSGAMLISKGITISQLSRGTAVRSDRVPKGYSFKYFICDDSGQPSLNKFQMVAWTFIAIGIYIFLVTREVGNSAMPVLPNIDDSLLVLMGISQGTYLGKRLVSSTSPVLFSLDKSAAKAGEEIILSGDNFGDKQIGGIVRIDQPTGQPGVVEKHYPSEIKKWENNKISLVLPDGLPAGLYNILALIGGKESNQLTIQIGPQP